jgi:hypothetical protein
MPLFQVAILEHPTKQEAEEGAQERLALKPVYVIAQDVQNAAITAVMDNPNVQVDRARMEVLVSPFV